MITPSFAQGAAPLAAARQLSDQERRRHHGRQGRRAAARRHPGARRPDRGGRSRPCGRGRRGDRRHRHDRHAGLRRHPLPHVERARPQLRRRRLRLFRRQERHLEAVSRRPTSTTACMLGLAELANAGVTTVHNWSHNTRSPAHAEAELRAHRESMLRALLCARPRRPDAARRAGRLRRHRPRQERVFRQRRRVRRARHLGVNLRGPSQSTPDDVPRATWTRRCEREAADRDPRRPDAAQLRSTPTDYEKRGWLGPKLLICHYLPATRRRRRSDGARPATPLSFATHSEFRLGRAGDPRDALLRMRKARGAGLAVVRRQLDRAAEHVRDHALHLEHGHPVARHADREGCPTSRSAR